MERSYKSEWGFPYQDRCDRAFRLRGGNADHRVQGRGSFDFRVRILEGNRANNGLRQRRGIFVRASHRKDEHIGPEAAEFGGKAALGIRLKIKERPGDRRSE